MMVIPGTGGKLLIDALHCCQGPDQVKLHLKLMKLINTKSVSWTDKIVVTQHCKLRNTPVLYSSVIWVFMMYSCRSFKFYKLHHKPFARILYARNSFIQYRTAKRNYYYYCCCTCSIAAFCICLAEYPNIDPRYLVSVGSACTLNRYVWILTPIYQYAPVKLTL